MKRYVTDVHRANRALVRRLGPQLRSTRPVEIVGLTDADGPFGVGLPGRNQWLMQVRLIAWRDASGVVHEAPLRCVRKGGEQAVRHHMQRLTRDQIIRLQVRLFPAEQPPTAWILRYCGEERDAKLESIRKKIMKPARRRLLDDRIFTLDRRAQAFDGRGLWGNRLIKVSLDLDRSGSPDRTLAHAVRIQSRTADIERVISAIAPTIYQHLEPNFRKAGIRIPWPQFVKSLQVTSLYVRADGSFSVNAEKSLKWDEEHIITFDGHVRRKKLIWDMI